MIIQTAPDGSRWAIERDALGHPVEITGPEGTTTLAYEDPRLPDRPTAVTDAQGATRRLEWNALGQLSAETDCSERRTSYAHDARGHLASVTNALGETTRTPHDVMGRRQSTQLPDGSHWHHHHDAQGRPVEQEGPQGYRQQLFYDEHGRPAQRIDADGSHTTLAYDEAGPDGPDGPDGREQRYAYDAAGQLIERTEVHRPDPDGQPLVTRFDYDANGRLIARHLPETDAAPATTERYHWRADGQLAGAENAHGEVTFVFDEAGRPSGEQQ
ncbi:RHS repeat protein, partial [Halomonas sp. 328]|nr:RHS repeat protein [Halomonas sp. 328]